MADFRCARRHASSHFGSPVDANGVWVSGKRSGKWTELELPAKEITAFLAAILAVAALWKLPSAAGDQIFVAVAERPTDFRVLQPNPEFDHNSSNGKAASARKPIACEMPAPLRGSRKGVKNMKSSTLFLILLVSSLAAAQQFPRYELSAGYSYGSPDDLSITNNRFSPQGWNGSFATNVKRWMAIEVDAGGQYINKSVLLGGTPYSLNSGFFAFHAGPRFAYRGEKMTPFVHTLFGVHRTLSYAQATFPTPGQVLVPYENAFGSAAGGGIDFALTRRLALRTQGDYFLTRLSTGSLTALNGYENRFRVVGGIVFNFGGTDRWSARRSRRPSPAASSLITRPESKAVADVAPAPTAPAPQSTPAYATVAPTPVVTATPASARPVPAPASGQTAPQIVVVPKPAAVTPAAQIPASARVVPSNQNLNSQIANRPAPVQREESLGEVARRYREKKRQQQQQQQQQQPR